MTLFNRHRQAPLFAAAVLAVITLIAAGCVKKITAPAAGTGDAVATDGGCVTADILFEFTDSAGAPSLAFTDSRDGQKYRAVKIGRDIWMAQNLNYETDNSRCSGDDESNCVKFGRLYDWEAAQTVCPVGWHISTAAEWDSLMMTAGGKREADDENKDGWNQWTVADRKLKAKTDWKTDESKDGNGTDDYGFSALPGGERYSSGKYMNPGEVGIWWMSNGGGTMEIRSDIALTGTAFIEEGLSVRCVSDDGTIVKIGERGSFSLTLKTGNGGTLSANPRKSSCTVGEKVTLTAVPDNGYAFAGWTGGRAADSASLITTITVISDTTVAVNFRRIDYGSLTDERDGKTYRTVKIGRKTWMAENLNYEPTKGRSSCLNGKAGNCEKYGRLYDWNTAHEACPAGWFLPSFNDWDALAVYAGGDDVAGRKLKAASGWVGDGGYRGTGTDDYGFSALPGGGELEKYRNKNICGACEKKNSFGAWWTTTTMYGGVVNARLTLHQNELGGLATDKKDMYSVRCVLDEGGTLTLAAALGGGTVSSVPRKTSFKAGETATITALPKSGYVFYRWTGGRVADPTAATTTVAVRSDMSIIARFRKAPGVSGTLADKRDGQKYKTTQIGGQVWMAQNLNYKTGNSWCYNDSASYCKEYGRLYDWKNAIVACPAGWHLPSYAEWDTLMRSVLDKNYSVYYEDDGDGLDKALKAKAGWNLKDRYDKDGNGTDDYGFAALPGGYRSVADDSGENPFEGAGNAGAWWTATKAKTENYVYFRSIGHLGILSHKDNGISVRCVMDGGNNRVSAQRAKRSGPAPKGGKPEIEMVFVKGGTFKMGCTGADKENCLPKEPAHNVTLGDFHIGKYEVTQKQWTQVMDGNPSGGILGDDYPVNNVGWDDIEEFIERLNAATGKKYRLPTEAEWEYAARGGADSKGYRYSGSDNPDDVAWHRENSGGEAHPVGLKAPNELGLYDMTGNIWEFTGDWFGDYEEGDLVNPTGPREGAAHAGRGGYWGYKPCQVYDRGYSPPGESSYNSGFRLVLLP